MSLKAESPWYKIYDLGMDPNDILDYLVPRLEQEHGDLNFNDNFSMGKHQVWVVDNAKHLYNHVDKIHPCMDLYTTLRKELVPSAFSFWIMPKDSELGPHVDAKQNKGQPTPGFVIVPLRGRTETKCYGPMPEVNPHYNPNNLSSLKNNDEFTMTFSSDDLEVVDTVVYEPGDVVVINNTKYIHSVHPLDDPRIALQFSAKVF